MKKKKAFTLVELLAVIVILAVILVIAVPQIMNVITEARKGTLISSAKLIASSAESMKISNDTLGIDKVLTCSDVAKINDEDYESCIVSFDENGKAKVTIVGKGKLEGMSVCGATKESSELSSECITDAACFSYEETQQVSSFHINEGKCKEYLLGIGAPEDIATTFCAGGEIYGFSLKDEINSGGLSASELETAKGISNVQYVDVISITGYSDVCPKDVLIPGKIDDKAVISIGYESFSNNQLTSVVIPNSVKSIKFAAFAHNQLTSVTIPNSVTSIDSLAFADNQLTSVSIPGSVIYIGEQAFNNNKLSDSYAYIYQRNIDGSIDNTYVVSYGGVKKDITIPNSVTTIGTGAFKDNQLTSVTIPNSVTTIGDGAFKENQLTSVTIPNSVTTIGNGAFEENQLTSVTIPNSVTTIGTKAFRYNQLTSVTIPNSVTTIGWVAFLKDSSSNPNLTSIVNTTGRSFDWNGIIRGLSGGTSAVTGTYNGVNVTTE